MISTSESLSFILTFFAAPTDDSGAVLLIPLGAVAFTFGGKRYIAEVSQDFKPPIELTVFVLPEST